MRNFHWVWILYADEWSFILVTPWFGVFLNNYGEALEQPYDSHYQDVRVIEQRLVVAWKRGSGIPGGKIFARERELVERRTRCVTLYELVTGQIAVLQAIRDVDR